MNEERIQLLNLLFEERPKLYVHGAESVKAGKEVAWPLNRDVLQWIAGNLPEKAVTLETGCGYSTMTFTFCGTSHTAIAPANQQHKRIARWCEDHGVSCANLNLVDSPSQDVLPGMDLEPLDLVLIDGCHAFPAPYIDWYYTAEKIKKGGVLIVDDCHLVTGKVLADFLELDKDRWVLHEWIGNTAIFRKITSEPVVEGLEWMDQPYCQISPIPKPGLLHRVLGKGKRIVRSVSKKMTS